MRGREGWRSSSFPFLALSSSTRSTDDPCCLTVDTDTLVQEMNDNIEERINLQKALFEIEDANIFNK